MSTKIAEVIESSTTGFIAEAYELYDLPSFGSLVKIIEPPSEIYGIVCQAGTASIEPGRRPIARGKDEASERAVYQTNPQLMKLLRSEFTVLVVGYTNDGKMYQYLPPKPAHIHAFIHPCSPDEVKRFSQSFDFLNLLITGNSQVPTEELIATVLREMSRVQDDPRAFLVNAGKSLTTLLSGDYQRLRAILGRLRT
ncbi:MAG TPA: hypothetical protein VGA85_02605 [Dehalococcoidales bacterium]